MREAALDTAIESIRKMRTTYVIALIPVFVKYATLYGEHIKKIYGPETEAQVSPDILADRLRKALEAKGIEFNEAADAMHVMQAALDYVEGRAGSGAKPSQTAESTRRMTDAQRSELIASSSREYDGAGSIGRVTDRVAFIGQALRDAGQTPLSEKERLNLPR